MQVGKGGGVKKVTKEKFTSIAVCDSGHNGGFDRSSA
jgi:hypothetical protein